MSKPTPASHHHAKHAHHPDWLCDLTEDAGFHGATLVRQRMGYRDGAAFFEEAPAGVLVHEALLVLETACPSVLRLQEELIDGPFWATYEAARNAYLLAALVFGRADLLAAVLLDGAKKIDRWSGAFNPAHVHRTLPMPVQNVLFADTPSDLLNVKLVTDLRGDLRTVPVWTAILLAARPAPRRYASVLKRLASAGATGFREHLAGKHPVLLNRAALDRAIEQAEAVADKAAYRRAQKAAAWMESRRRSTAGKASPSVSLGDDLDALLNEARDALVDAQRGTQNPDLTGLLNDVIAVAELPSDEPSHDVQDQATLAIEADLERMRQRDAINALVSADLPLDVENGMREGLGLPPLFVDPRAHERRALELKLVGAIRLNRPVDVSKALLEGADPNTPLIEAGVAMGMAVHNRQLRTLRMLLAHGADPTVRLRGFTLLSHNAGNAKNHFDGGFDDREAMEDAMDCYIEIQSLLVRAGATADQLNARQLPDGTLIQPHPEEPDAWHWIRQVPPLYESYLDALDERKQIVEEVGRALEQVKQAVRDLPELEKEAQAAAKAMLDEAKRRAKGG
ncbi:TPA: hypothetical protein QDB01_000337 [Burkholderia vietnamiensis]|nr:hypothetical protein [Burkholderia vietnamiensis]